MVKWIKSRSKIFFYIFCVSKSVLIVISTLDAFLIHPVQAKRTTLTGYRASVRLPYASKHDVESGHNKASNITAANRMCNCKTDTKHFFSVGLLYRPRHARTRDQGQWLYQFSFTSTLSPSASEDMEDLFLPLLVGLICRDDLLTVQASEIPLSKGGIWDVWQRYRRQAMRVSGGAMPPMNEAHAEREGVFDPAFLAAIAMFQASGFLPSMGSSTMNNGFSSLCTYHRGPLPWA